MRRRRWLRWTVVVLVVLWAASLGVSWLLQTRRMRGYLTRRLEAAFGRPVEVGRFDFSLLRGPRLEANYVTVAEDPRFGYEYFLRAEHLTASPRWSLLARGRLEFGSLSFTRSSLNLVRAADGHWNVESWLPPPVPRPGPAPAASPQRLYRIEIKRGRINFKRGVEKHPFALVDVAGHLEQEAAGRWRLDLECRPTRTAVELQDIGTLRLRGLIAGTSARLQPAELVFTWDGASLADVLRLARGQDYGVRGSLGLELSARIPGPAGNPPATDARELSRPGSLAKGAPAAAGARWTLAWKVWATGIHRWDMPQRPGDPALSLRAEAQWWPGEARMEFSKGVLEGPRSSLQASGSIRWALAIHPHFELSSAGVSVADLLAWYRAFRPGVANDLAADGSASLALTLDGWPPRVEQGTLTSRGATLRTTRLRQAVHLGPWKILARRGRLELQPATISFAANAPAGTAGPGLPANVLRLEGAVGKDFTGKRGEWGMDIQLAGQMGRVEDWLAALAALGQPRFAGWNIEGQVAFRLQWLGSLRPFRLARSGVVDLHDLRLQSRFLNQPVVLGAARVELLPYERRVTLLAAQAFGARWSGSLVSRDPAQPWELDLSADRLDAAELDRWLGPRARSGLLQRIFPFVSANQSSVELEGMLNALRGRGQLWVQEVHLSPLSLRRLRGELEIAGRSVTLRQAQADLYGGAARGSLRAELSAEPSYQFQGRFDQVRLETLAAATTALRGRVAGTASGELELRARSVGRENLLRSLEGRGRLQVRRGELHGVDLMSSFLDTRLHRGITRFSRAEAAFTVSNRRILAQKLLLSGGSDEFEGEGSVDFARALDLRLRRVGLRNGGPGTNAPSATLRLAGTLDAPQIVPRQSTARSR